jgi:hypothetical protein
MHRAMRLNSPVKCSAYGILRYVWDLQEKILLALLISRPTSSTRAAQHSGESSRPHTGSSHVTSNGLSYRYDADPSHLIGCHVMSAGPQFPDADESVGIIINVWTFRDVTSPDRLAHELTRVLTVGGWIYAWAVTKWSLTGIGCQRSSLTPVIGRQPSVAP